MAEQSQPGTLHVVATPIGNLGDITLRAIEVLRSVSLIACEDTRRTRTILDRHGIAVPLVSYHKFNERKTAGSIVSRLVEGQSVALVCDGGTPAFSDPGYRLVADALAAGVPVTPVPGPCAFVAAVSASGLPSDRVTFRGFLPHRSGERRRAIEEARGESATQVFYESPHRIVASLRDLAELLGPRRAALARELTKKFETWYRGTLEQIAAQVAAEPARGEYCLVVEGARQEAAAVTESPAGVRAAYDRALGAGLDRREALKRAAGECGLTRKEAYRILNAGEDGEDGDTA